MSDSDEESGSKVDNSLLNQITVAQLVPFTFINTYYQICQPIWTFILPKFTTPVSQLYNQLYSFVAMNKNYLIYEIVY